MDFRRIFYPLYWCKRLVQAFFLFLLLDIVFPLPPDKPWSQVVLARDGSLLSAYLSPDDKWRMRVQVQELSPQLVTAILAKEDRWFWYHPGVNPLALGRAACNNVLTGRRTSGASTITMQVARLMEPRPRTFLSKFIEIFRAFQLEWHFSKTEILERYLSYLPYGGNVEGVKAASWIYFDRPPDKLSLAQATLLTVIPNRPNSLRMDRGTESAREMRDKWLRRFEDEGTFPATEVQTALTEPIQAGRHPIRQQAPHFSRMLQQQHTAPEIHSTLDPATQTIAEALLTRYVQRARSKGISNGAVLVLDNRDNSVMAWCGSSDFYNVEDQGQVDGVRAIRSPGSALKPSLYTLAFDLGLCTPHSRLLDIPSNFEGYDPENYDLKFRGPVTAADALRSSLNIPAVALLQQTGYDRYMDLLERAGYATITRQRRDLGLSVILGGCGVTLEEMTRQYSALARGGRMHPVNYTHDQATRDSSTYVQLFSPEAAWMMTDILSGLERPDLPAEFLQSASKARIAWKTGTSYGRRDAWAIGYTPRYTIGVWIGNFNGAGAQELSGATMAVPLLVELFDALESGKPLISWPRPPGVQRRTVCAETGDLPGELCTRTAEDWYLRDRSHRRTCTQEMLLYISPDSALQYCTECLPPTGYLRAGYPVYPARLSLWYDVHHTHYRIPPPHNPRCTSRFQGEGPQISSPEDAYDYLIEEGGGGEILLQAASDKRIARHYWYINGKFFKSSAPGETVFWEPVPGRSRISCMDDQGRTSQVSIQVKMF